MKFTSRKLPLSWQPEPCYLVKYSFRKSMLSSVWVAKLNDYFLGCTKTFLQPWIIKFLLSNHKRKFLQQSILINLSLEHPSEHFKFRFEGKQCSACANVVCKLMLHVSLILLTQLASGSGLIGFFLIHIRAAIFLLCSANSRVMYKAECLLVHLCLRKVGLLLCHSGQLIFISASCTILG